MKDKILLLLTVFALAGFLTLAGCGGGGSASSSTNSSGSPGGPQGSSADSVSLSVGPGPSDMTNPAGGYTNILFATVTLCEPGTSTCQSIDHVLVDTGSYGLRILASEVPSGISLNGATVGGKNLYECLPFVDSYAWGKVVTADVEMAGEKGSGIPVQLIQNATAPSDCSSTVATSGSSSVKTVNDLGAKGIIGVGSFTADCGGYCTSVAKFDFYFTCSSSDASTCSQAAVPESQQVINPVSKFSSDHNGVVIQMASVGNGGAGSASGTMYFGIGTQSNNTPASGVKVLGLNGYGNFGTSFQSKSYPNSFADTGSNSYFVGTYDSSTKKASTGIAVCNLGSSSNPAYFYCPSSELSETATMSSSSSSATKSVSFNVGNANTLNGYAMSDLAATNSDGTSFDWGLPFFYGRTVYVGLDGTSSSLGSGAYVAF
ncbi:MAG TPA: DUF3443 family protein [Candidatus Koribacter sp.]|jgi:hypothetical protein